MLPIFWFWRKNHKKPILIIAVLFMIGIGFQSFAAIENLSEQQKLDDFRYMYRIFAENYPFFEVKKRVYNFDWRIRKDEFEAMISKTKSDREFEQAIHKILDELHSGHTYLLETEDYNRSLAIATRANIKNPWLDILQRPEVIARYQSPSTQNPTIKNDVKNNSLKERSRYKFDLIEPGEIAYLRMYSFDPLNVKTDHEPIYTFLQSIRDYPVLIIDIRKNGGGAQQYWKENIVAPLINRDLKAEYYGFIRGGSYFKPFYKFTKAKLGLVKQLAPEVIKDFPPEVRKDFKYYYQIIHNVSPAKPVGFHGKIYLLIDGRSYSAADTFASFSKATKFATLVGERTKGDGIGNPAGLDMPLLSLPNSGFVIRFPTGLGLNPDGSSNEEKCTEPDIPVTAPIAETYDKDSVIQRVIKLSESL